MFKLAFRNIASKPLRSAVTVLAIAVAVAMIFAMLSFSPAVYEYIFSTQTAASGGSDIVISTSSSSDRITDVTKELNGLEGIDYICPSLTLYALLGNEYVQLRGFEVGKSEMLQSIDVRQGSLSGLSEHEDDIVISSATAEKYDLHIGDRVELTLGRQNVSFYVCAIADKSGYFLNDAPNLILGRIEGIERLLTALPIGDKICNEIYIKAKAGVDIDGLMERISSMQPYSSMLVQRTGGSYIKEQADSLSAPVVLAGVAVFALAIAVVVLLFMMSEGEKLSFISKLSVIGATKGQIAGVFLIESILLAMAGAVIGSALAVGVFVGILKLTLSSTIAFGISAWRLFLAAAIGFFSAVVSSALPIFRAFRGTIRQNQLNMQRRSRLSRALCPILLALCAVSVALEFAVPSLTAAVSVVSLVLLLVTLGVCVASVLRLSARGLQRSANPSVKVAAINIRREGRFSRSVTALTVGMTVSMLLFMAWSLTQSVFGDYVADFSDLIFVTNVRSDVDLSRFDSIEGVDTATKIVWKQGSLKGEGFDKTMNILGSRDALGLVDFGYVTPKQEVQRLLNDDGGQGYVFLDNALSVLYGVKTGDRLTLTLDGVESEVTVGGILQHRLFSGNYIVMSDEVIAKRFGTMVDTVVIKADKDVDGVANELRAKFAANNYYVVDVLTAYKWDMESTSAVFDLIGTLAVVVALFIFVITVFASQAGRTSAEKNRTALLNAGMSKRALWGAEITEHCLVAAVSLVLSFALSVLLTACLIHALRLFGLYFEFMYEAWVVAVVGLIMGGLYAAVPLAFNFKKSYSIKKR